MLATEEVSPSEIKARLAKGEKLQIIDVREPSELAAGAIPGAINVPLSSLPARYHEINRNQETIMVCRSGARSGKACEFLSAKGYSNLKNMTGGMIQWDS